jgi:hypothetical protein
MNTLDHLNLERKLDPVSKKGIKISFKKNIPRSLTEERTNEKEEEKEEEKDEISKEKQQKKEFEKKIFKITDKTKKSHIDRESILERLSAFSKTESQLVDKSPIREPVIIPYTISEYEKEKKDYETFSETVLNKDISNRKIEELQDEDEVIEETERGEKEGEGEEGEEKEGEEKEGEGEKGEEKEGEGEKGEEKEEISKKASRKTRKIKEPTMVTEEPRLTGYLQVKIGKTIVQERLPQKERIIIRSSPYYMNNRKLFIQKLASAFTPYREKIQSSEADISCEDTRKENIDFSLLTHQQIVRDYLNLYTPYRGLLLYHGLGSGKTCSSIGIAEGMKSEKRVVLMTPASLKMNFFSELKKCGDHIYKKNQFWEFISIDGQPQMVSVLSQALSLSPEYIRTKKGAWMVDVTKPTNFSQLSSNDQKNVDEQINMMIRAKYLDINYNGLNDKKMEELGRGNRNPFDHSTVIIDEAHNLVSRIGNKLKTKKSIAYRIYQWLLDATDVRIVLLTGTPIINYPHEIGVLFNILRGHIKTWEFQLATTTTKRIDRDTILERFKDANFKTYDYVEYSGDTLTITRNPFGFINVIANNERRGGSKEDNHEIDKEKEEEKELKEKNKSKKSKTKKIKIKILEEPLEEKQKKSKKSKTKKSKKIDEEESEEMYSLGEKEEADPTFYKMSNDISTKPYEGGGPFEDYKGVILDVTGNISNTDFQKRVVEILKPIASVIGKPKITNYKSLPDDSKKFIEMFINPTGEVVNIDLFKRRVLGLTSYFRSAQEKLLPSFVKTESNETYHKIMVEMSDHQFAAYDSIRFIEREQEKQQKKTKRKKGLDGEEIDDKLSSTYRIFSRAACNFTFPTEIERPMPPKKKNGAVDENAFNGITSDIAKKTDDYFEEDEGDEEYSDVNFEDATKEKKVKKPKKVVEAKTEAEAEDDGDIEGGGAGFGKVSDGEIISYQTQIENAMKKLAYNPVEPRETNYLLPEGLAQYSPKFLKILENIKDPENEGLHLLYSQFRTIEGIGILKLILEANGYAQFKIEKKADNEWEIVEEAEDSEKPKFILYTGTESAEEKEILRNIYISAWELVPSGIVSELRKKSNEKKNFMGEIIKLMMITSSGAEGINLRNCRFVHIVEPYWNKVRLEQVIGRARRICSHEDLPEELRTVKVFVYMSVIPEKLLLDKKNEKIREIREFDHSKKDLNIPFTTDQTLFEIAEIKDKINSQILKAIKETSIDCSIYNNNPDEPLTCYGFGLVRENQFSSYPKLETDLSEKVSITDAPITKWVGVEIEDPKTGTKYAMNPKTKEVYDLESYKQNITNGTDMILIGRLVEKIANGKKNLLIQNI